MSAHPRRDPWISPEHRALGAAIRIARKQRRLSQEELGYRARLHRNQIGFIERGEHSATFRVLLKIEHGLGTSLSELMKTYESVLHEADEAPTR